MTKFFTFIISRCFVQHQNYSDMEMNKQKSQNKFKNKNKLKERTVKNHTNIKNAFQKINHELHEQKHLLCHW